MCEVHLCRSSRHAFPEDRRHFDRVTPLLMAYGQAPAMRTRFGDTVHELWRLDDPVPNSYGHPTGQLPGDDGKE